MLYWLTFIQSLPTIPLSEIPTSQLEPKQYQGRNPQKIILATKPN
ncbi:hypothetical protein [Nodularia chucula]